MPMPTGQASDCLPKKNGNMSLRDPKGRNIPGEMNGLVRYATPEETEQPPFLRTRKVLLNLDVLICVAIPGNSPKANAPMAGPGLSFLKEARILKHNHPFGMQTAGQEPTNGRPSIFCITPA